MVELFAWIRYAIEETLYTVLSLAILIIIIAALKWSVIYILTGIVF